MRKQNVSKTLVRAVISVLLLLIMLCLSRISVMTVFAGENAETENTEIYSTVDDLEGKTIVVITGTACDQIAEDTWDDIHIMYVDSLSDAILALNTEKADAYLSDGPYARYIASQDADLACMDVVITSYDTGLAFQKTEEGRALCAEFNTYVAKWKADGTIDEILDVWTDANAEKPEIDLDSLTGEKGTIRYGADGALPPFNYVEDNHYAGLEMDLVYRFCKEAGYKMEMTSMNFSGLIQSLTAGKQDIVACCISITPERSQSVQFSDPVYDDDIIPVVLAKHTAQGASENSDQGFFRSIASSFKKTFITENRWLLFVQGIGQTLLITLSSLVFGTLLGFALYLWLWTGQKAAKVITRIFEWLMNRMPMVVLLMILFYIVFADTELSGTGVSIIGFTLVFGGCVFGLIKSGVAAIDPGQMEASLALGYTRTKAFFKVILPQAVRHFMPGYKGEVVSLIKSTAIVGYVAVMDLTKVSDLVRSRTYEPFFPLIVTAAIYLVLAELLILLVTIVDRHLFAKERTEKQILKGVKTDD